MRKKNCVFCFWILTSFIVSGSISYSQSLVINELMPSNSVTIPDEDGEYSDWIELFNPLNENINLSGYGLSDDPSNPFKWIFPSVNLSPSDYLLVFASDKNRTNYFNYLHTNFKLSSDGEVVVITNPQGFTVDKVSFGKLGPDVSYGRQPDGSSSWYLFPKSTPGDSNTTQAYTGTAAEPVVSPPGGFYFTSVTINLTVGSPNDNIYYTLDGSDPDENSQLYTDSIQIDETKVLRFKAFSTGLLPSRILTNTYLINFSSTLPVISLSTNPGNLFDEEYGIYTLGDSADTTYPYYGANYWQDWERPIHVELFESNGIDGFSIDAGIQIFGGWSRVNAQKSFSIFARGKYGYSSLNYKLFDDLPFTEYEAFVLRNGGTDWGATMLRDGLMTSLIGGIDIDKQDYRPAIVFINGEYWGILNIREKVNEHFIAQHHNINPDSLDILESFSQIIQGDNIDYLVLSSFIEDNNMAIPANYDYVKTKMEVDNFVRYFVSEIYFANTDWPGGNIKYWKKSETGKWRWILYDTDAGFGMYGQDYSFSHNTLEFATAPNSSNESNPPWSTLFLRKLLQNDSFKYDFINCFADYSNSIFDPTVVVNKINSIKSVIEPEIPRHGARWSAFNLDQWSENIQVLRDFASQRIAYMRIHFMQKFELAGLAPVNLSISDTTKGSIKLNSLDIKTSGWTGNYFLDVPISIIAQPEKGFRFIRWEGSLTSSDNSLSITLSDTLNLNAIFEADSNFSAIKVVINEINYNSASTFNTEDWIELYNNGENSVDISGWIFKDSDNAHVFTIPQGTILDTAGYLVLCIDTSLFEPLFPEAQNFIGNVGFGLSGSGELVRLYDNQLLVMDSLVYDDAAPWPTQPDGNGPTLSLKNPDLDNSFGGNWAASMGNGTPGKVNDVLTSSNDKHGLPTDYLLFQNYPNPFNPNTRIKWQSPVGSKQTLKIYDVMGIEIATLIDEYRPAGFHEVEFQSKIGNRQLASGVYFYRLISGEFVQTRKMLLKK